MFHEVLAKTDIQVKVPHGTYGRIAPRSGLAWKNHIDIGAGVVDEDYRGNVGVVMFNHAEVEFQIKKGDRIAQLVCEKISYPDLEDLDLQAPTDAIYFKLYANLTLIAIWLKLCTLS